MPATSRGRRGLSGRRPPLGALPGQSSPNGAAPPLLERPAKRRVLPGFLVGAGAGATAAKAAAREADGTRTASKNKPVGSQNRPKTARPPADGTKRVRTNQRATAAAPTSAASHHTTGVTVACPHSESGGSVPGNRRGPAQHAHPQRARGIHPQGGSAEAHAAPPFGACGGPSPISRGQQAATFPLPPQIAGYQHTDGNVQESGGLLLRAEARKRRLGAVLDEQGEPDGCAAAAAANVAASVPTAGASAAAPILIVDMASPPALQNRPVAIAVSASPVAAAGPTPPSLFPDSFDASALEMDATQDIMELVEPEGIGPGQPGQPNPSAAAGPAAAAAAAVPTTWLTPTESGPRVAKRAKNDGSPVPGSAQTSTPVSTAANASVAATSPTRSGTPMQVRHAGPGGGDAISPSATTATRNVAAAVDPAGDVGTLPSAAADMFTTSSSYVSTGGEGTLSLGVGDTVCVGRKDGPWWFVATPDGTSSGWCPGAILDRSDGAPGSVGRAVPSEVGNSAVTTTDAEDAATVGDNPAPADMMPRQAIDKVVDELGLTDVMSTLAARYGNPDIIWPFVFRFRRPVPSPACYGASFAIIPALAALPIGC